MAKTVRTVYDGRVLLPEEPIDLKPQTHVRITIEMAEKRPGARARRRSFLETAQSLKLDGPRDGSRCLEEYLYGER